MFEKVRLGDVCDLSIGFVGTVTTQYQDGGIPFFRTLNIKPYKIDDKDLRRITPEFHETQKKSQLFKDDVIMVHTGVPGICCVIPEEYDNSNCIDAIVIKCHKNRINPFYLEAYMNTVGYKHIEKQQVGCVQKHFNLSDAAELEIFLPNIVEQKRIATLVKNANDKYFGNISISSDLESMAKLLYDYWFVQFDFPDENGRPYKSSGGKMVWNEELKRKIPEGWAVNRIGEIISTERGISYSTPNIETGNGVPMLNLATFMPGGGDYKADGLKYFLGDYPKSKVLKPYDLILCNTQQTAVKFETDIIGRAMLVPDVFDGDVVFSHHVNVIRTQDEKFKYYLLYLFNSDYYHKYITGFTNGTNILGLSFSGVEDYLTEIPPQDILAKFGKVVLECERKKSEIIIENRQLASLRDFLLPMLINGQVKVKGQYVKSKD